MPVTEDILEELLEKTHGITSAQRLDPVNACPKSSTQNRDRGGRPAKPRWKSLTRGPLAPGVPCGEEVALGKAGPVDESFAAGNTGRNDRRQA
jgi:hypothetical protein